MKQFVLTLAILSAASHGWAADHDRDRPVRISAELEPSNEVPAVSSPALGRFTARISDEAIEYELTFDRLQAPITQSHIHFAQPDVNGGIMVWLCGTSANPGPAGTQVCPQSGTITGTIVAGNILALTTQGIVAGRFEQLVAALRSGLAYANIHTVQSPAGEIRGQIKVRDRR